jgi:hypothetical protein
LSTLEDAAPAAGVGMKIIGDNLPDVFQSLAQVLPGIVYTYLYVT